MVVGFSMSQLSAPPSQESIAARGGTSSPLSGRLLPTAYCQVQSCPFLLQPGVRGCCPCPSLPSELRSSLAACWLSAAASLSLPRSFRGHPPTAHLSLSHCCHLLQPGFPFCKSFRALLQLFEFFHPYTIS